MARVWTLEWEAVELTLPSATAPQFLTANGHPILAFDAAADEFCYAEGFVPAEYAAGTITLRLHCGAQAAANVARMEAYVEKLTPGTDAYSSDSFSTVNTASVTIASSQRLEKLDITLSALDSWAVGDSFRIKISRDADGSGGTDSLTVDLELLRVELFEGS